MTANGARPAWRLVLFVLVIVLIVAGFLLQMSRGICPVP